MIIDRVVRIEEIATYDFTNGNNLIAIFVPTDNNVSDMHIVLHIIKHLDGMERVFCLVFLYFIFQGLLDGIFVTKFVTIQTSDFSPFVD